MLSKLLSRKECAECRICCCFDSSDIWETPIIDSITQQKVKSINPNQEFLDFENNKNSKLLKLKKQLDEDLYYCTLLDKNIGCKLGAEKPFDCRIWPFRVLKLDSRLVVGLSPVCPVVAKRPVEQVAEVARELAPMIFEYAKKNPDIVKEYKPEYTILVVDDF